MRKNNIFRNLIIACAISAVSAMTATAMQEMAKDYPLTITAESDKDTAVISITGVIWEYNNSARSFKAKINEFIKAGIKNVKLYINTPGGDVFQANEIANEIERFDGTITGEGGALVASAGTYIAMSCDSFTMPSNGQWMYHMPMATMRGNVNQIESNLQGLKNVTEDYLERYSKKTGLTKATLKANWDKGDVWLSAKDAAKQKFITSVTGTTSVTAQESLMIAACGAPIKPTATTSKNKPLIKTEIEMELSIMAVKAGLPETATQAEYDAHIIALQNSATEAKNLKQAAEDKVKVETATGIKAMFDEAVKVKKITAKQAENMQGWADKDLEGCKAHIDALVAPTKPTSTPSAGTSKGIDGKKFEELTKAQAEELEENDPVAFNALYDAYLDQE